MTDYSDRYESWRVVCQQRGWHDLIASVLAHTDTTRRNGWERHPSAQLPLDLWADVDALADATSPDELAARETAAARYIDHRLGRRTA